MHTLGLLAGQVLAGITWDPFIRGVLIITVAVLVLPGSVYLILATDTGARVGFMIAMAGLFGWIFIMAVVWAVFGIGDVGRAASWKTRGSPAWRARRFRGRAFRSRSSAGAANGRAGLRGAHRARRAR